MEIISEDLLWIRHCFYLHYLRSSQDRISKILSWFGVAEKQTLRHRLEFRKFIWELILRNTRMRIRSQTGPKGSP